MTRARNAHQGVLIRLGFHWRSISDLIVSHKCFLRSPMRATTCQLHFTTLFGRGARNGNIATSQLDSTFGNEMTVIATRVIWVERLQAPVDHHETAFCVETLAYSLARPRQAGHLQHGSGSQFAGQAFTGVLADNGIVISMDGTAHGETTFLSNGSGATSNTRRCARYDSVSQARSPNRPISQLP